VALPLMILCSARSDQRRGPGIFRVRRPSLTAIQSRFTDTGSALLWQSLLLQ
jgi:hypothetical protein